MKKNTIKKGFFIIFLTIITIIICSIKTHATDNKYMLVYGKIQDTEGNAIKDISLYVEGNEDDNFIYSVDNQGNYIAFVNINSISEKKKLKYEINDGNNYNINNISNKSIKYSLTSGISKLRLICTYPSEDIYNFYEKISGNINKTTESNFGIQYNEEKYKYNIGDNVVQNMISKTGSIGTGMLVSKKAVNICWVDDSCTENVRNALDQKALDNYNTIFNYTTNSIETPTGSGNIYITNNKMDTLNKAYEYFGFNRSESSETINGVADQNRISTSEINVEYDYEINIILEKTGSSSPEEDPSDPEDPESGGDTDPGNQDLDIREEHTINFDSDKENFITGNIKLDDGTNIDCSSKNKVIVRLVDIVHGTKVDTIYPDSNGYFSFKYPEAGKYKVEYLFYEQKEEGINGENYEIASGAVNINSASYGANVAKYSNIDEIKNNFKEITLNEEENELNNQTGKCTLIAWTDEFNVEATYLVDTDGDGIEDTKVYPTSDKNATAIIKYRDQFKLEVSEEINNVVLTLSNGQNLINWNGGQADHVLAVDGGKNGMRIDIIDDYVYGSSLYVRYKILLENKSNITCKGYKLISNYTGFEYEENITNYKKKNKDTGWKKIEDIESFKKYNMSLQNDENYLFLELDEDIIPGETKEIYIAFSRLLNDQDENNVYSHRTELVNYKNEEGRRNYKDTGVLKCGNFDWQNKENHEEDDDYSGSLTIIPPTGFSKIKKYILICNIGTLIILIIIIHYRKKEKRLKSLKQKITRS